MQMYFDWIKAAKLIKSKAAKNAVAGLCGDWEYNSTWLMEGGKLNVNLDDCFYSNSNWATPVIIIEGETFNCYYEADEGNWDRNNTTEKYLEEFIIDVSPEGILNEIKQFVEKK